MKAARFGPGLLVGRGHALRAQIDTGIDMIKPGNVAAFLARS